MIELFKKIFSKDHPKKEGDTRKNSKVSMHVYGNANNSNIKRNAFTNVLAIDDADSDAEQAPCKANIGVAPSSSDNEESKATLSDQIISDKTMILATDRSLFKTILSALYDAVLIVDPKGYVIASNRRTETIFGYQEKDLWNIECHKLIQGLTPIALNKIKTELNNNRFFVLTAQCVRQTGSLFKAEVTIGKISFLNEFDLLLSIRRIDNREWELEALSNTIAGLLVCRDNGVIEYANTAMLRMLLLNRNDEIQGRHLKEFCDSQKMVDLMLKIPTAEIRWSGIAALKTSKGKNIECHAFSVLSSTHFIDGHKRFILTFMPHPEKARAISNM